MLTYTIRRLMLSIPTLLFISLIIFLLLNLAPGDPMASQPLTIPPEVRQKMREALGLGAADIRPLPAVAEAVLLDRAAPRLRRDLRHRISSAGMQRDLRWQIRSPVFDIIVQRMPQTLWVVGMSYMVGVLIALPIGIISAYRQYSLVRPGRHLHLDDRLLGADLLHRRAADRDLLGQPALVPVDLRHQPAWSHDWAAFIKQVRQMVMPVMVLALYNAAQISRFMRASMLDNLGQDYVRTARAKGMTERVVSCFTSCATR